MKRICLLVVFVFCLAGIGQAQDKYRTSKGEIRFNASTPLEDIDATNNLVNAILDTSTGNFAVVMLIREFNFKRKLMQEHFNEDYMESNTYPKATFSGTIENFDLQSLNSDMVEKKVSGKFTIHGVSLSRTETIRLKKEGDYVLATINFIVRPEDHDIEVPKVVFKKVAQEVQVWVDLKMEIP